MHGLYNEKDCLISTMYNGPAWHGMGSVPSLDAQMIKDGPFNFDILKEPHKYEWNGLTQTSELFNLVKSDDGKLLGIVTSDYQPWQPSELVDLLEELRNGSEFESACVLFGGEREFATLRLGKEIKVGDDVSYGYLLASAGNTGKSAVTIGPCITRAVCNNTVRPAMGESRASGMGYHIGHHPNLKKRIEQAKQGLSKVLEDVERYNKDIVLLSSKDCTEFEEYCLKLYPKPKVVKELIQTQIVPGLVEESKTRAEKNHLELLNQLYLNFQNPDNNPKGAERSWFSALNSVTQYENHQRKGKGKNKWENRLDSIMFGKSSEIMQAAHKLALSYC